MKNVILPLTLVAIVITSAALPSPAFAAEHGQSLCNFVAADEKKRLRKYLRNNKLKIRKIFSQLVCNDKNLLIFASEMKAVKTGSFMISKLPKDVVATNLPQMQSAPAKLLRAAKKRIGG